MRYSILNSSDIYLIEVSEKHPRTAEVTQVITGDHKIGEKHKSENINAFKYGYSNSIVFCQESMTRDGYGLFFNYYSKVDIPEIYWILKGDSVLHNDQEALTGILGLSYEYSSLAVDYCIKNHDRMLPSLIRLADSLNAALQENEVEYYNWRITNLHNAIFSQHNKEADAYANKWITIYAEDTSKITWPGFLYFPHEAFFLSLISNAKEKYCKTFTDLTPRLSDRTLCTVFYALLQSGCTDPYSLEKEITDQQQNVFALALYSFNRFYTRKHSYDQAQEYYRLALKHATDKRLMDEINEEIKQD